jgi:hypothetical protein
MTNRIVDEVYDHAKECEDIPSKEPSLTLPSLNTKDADILRHKFVTTLRAANKTAFVECAIDRDMRWCKKLTKPAVHAMPPWLEQVLAVWADLVAHVCVRSNDAGQ